MNTITLTQFAFIHSINFNRAVNNREPMKTRTTAIAAAAAAVVIVRPWLRSVRLTSKVNPWHRIYAHTRTHMHSSWAKLKGRSFVNNKTEALNYVKLLYDATTSTTDTRTWTRRPEKNTHKSTDLICYSDRKKMWRKIKTDRASQAANKHASDESDEHWARIKKMAYDICLHKKRNT